MYYAPIRPRANPTVRVVATAGLSTAEGMEQLTSHPADPGDCLAEGQTSDERFVFVEELPEAIVKVSPSYPDLAREAGVDGTVMVQAHVCACGEVAETRIQRSIPMLDSAATTAVRQWIFKPALSNGEPVAVWVGVPVRFSLH
jgi:protein TonB